MTKPFILTRFRVSSKANATKLSRKLHEEHPYIKTSIYKKSKSWYVEVPDKKITKPISY